MPPFVTRVGWCCCLTLVLIKVLVLGGRGGNITTTADVELIMMLTIVAVGTQ